MKTQAQSQKLSMHHSSDRRNPWILVLVVSLTLLSAQCSTVASRKDDLDAAKLTAATANECESKILDSDVPDPVRDTHTKYRHTLLRCCCDFIFRFLSLFC